MNDETTVVGESPFVLPEPRGTALPPETSDLEGPFEVPVASETRSASTTATPSRRRYATWSDADDQAKRRNARDQVISGRPLTDKNVLVYAPPAGRNERIFVLQNFKIDGAALRGDHRAYLAVVASWMARGGKWRIFAEAHSSRTGTRRHDDLLSEDRYLATRAWLETELQRHGVNMSRVRIAGEGVGFRHSPLPGEDPMARSVYAIVQPDPSSNPPQAWPPKTIPTRWPPTPTPGDLTVDDFMEAVQAAESANPSDSPEQSLTRFRQLYYPGTDPESLTIREAAFDRLLPDAPFLLPDGTRRILTSKGMDRTHFNDSRSTLPRTQPPDIHSITPVPISSMRSAPVSALDTFC
jgi:outer membrane protein OmpA-like peptidoglycan-associated protein